MLSKGSGKLKDFTFQNIDFTTEKIDWSNFIICSTTLLGCKLKEEDEIHLLRKGALILPDYNELPFNPYREHLYTWQELEAISTNEKSLDLNIYEHFYETRYSPSINDSLWQRIHDHAIDTSLRHLLTPLRNGDYKKKIVGFMGGHGTLRTDPYYTKTAFTAKAISEYGYFVASGGGPGIMEATNLGAYFSGRSDKELQKAIEMLSIAPHFTDEGFMEISKEVIQLFPEGQESLAIPTWFYGHEPSNVFASHIAKYFSNSIREDTLLAICLHGIIYAPGSAGTTQEIFMDAAQNHYGTFGYVSPMVFLGKERYEMNTMLFPVLKQLAKGKAYQKMLFLTDDPEQAIQFIEKNPPKKIK
nr:hypothetical protein [Portibacter lacus]